MLGLSFLNSASGDGVEEERRVKGEVWPVVWPDEMHPCPWWASCLRRQARERVGVANGGIACCLLGCWSSSSGVYGWMVVLGSPVAWARGHC